MRWASTLPSSTPHWSNELMSQIAPWVKTLCSYSATSLPERRRRQALGQNGVGGPVALEHPVRHQPVRRALGLDLLGGLAEGQRLGLGEDVGQQHVVVPPSGLSVWPKAMKSHGNQPRALVDQLVEGVLAVGARLAPVDRAGVVVDRLAVERDVLAVALHGQLLQIGRKALQVLLVGQHGDGLRAEEVVVPDARAAPSAPAGCARTARCGSARPSRGSPPSMARKLSGPDGEHGRQADGRVHRIAAADPVPEPEHVGGVDAELRTPSAALVETATKCLATAFSSPPRPVSDQSRARMRRWSSSPAW